MFLNMEMNLLECLQLSHRKVGFIWLCCPFLPWPGLQRRRKTWTSGSEGPQSQGLQGLCQWFHVLEICCRSDFDDLSAEAILTVHEVMKCYEETLGDLSLFNWLRIDLHDPACFYVTYIEFSQQKSPHRMNTSHCSLWVLFNWIYMHPYKA